LQKIESLIGRKLDEYKDIDTKQALILNDAVMEASRIANQVGLNFIFLYNLYRK
jgi:hypothetical protein